MNTPSIHLLNTSQVRAGDNDRRTFAPKPLQELAESIRDNGLAQPITVRPMVECAACGHIHPAHEAPIACDDCQSETWTSFYQIVAGERRFRACSDNLEWEQIPAIVRELGDEQADAIMLTENVHRVDLNPIDEGHAYDKRIERHLWSIAETARRANVSEGRVKNRLALLKLRPEAQHLVATGNLSLGFGEEMSVLDNNRQLMALSWLREQKSVPSRRVFAAMVGELYNQQCQDSFFNLDDFFVAGVAEAVKGSESGRLCDILPRLPGLPDLPTKQGSVGKVLDEYAAALFEQGHDQVALVIVDLWAKLVGANYGNISPFESKTLALLTSR